MSDSHSPLTRSQARKVDELAVQELHIPSLILMENAGRGVAERIAAEWSDDSHTLIICGKGNNGGDGFVIARQLMNMERSVSVVALFSGEDLAGDAAVNFQILKNLGGQIFLANTPETYPALQNQIAKADLVIDAMLGTGVRGEIREPFSTLIPLVNHQSPCTWAIDLPSGLDCDSGLPCGDTILAQKTFTFVAPKIGLTIAEGPQRSGTIEVLPIGIPNSWAIDRVLNDSPDA